MLVPVTEEVKIYLQIQDGFGRWVPAQFNVIVLGDKKNMHLVAQALERKLRDMNLSDRAYQLNHNYLNCSN